MPADVVRLCWQCTYWKLGSSICKQSSRAACRDLETILIGAATLATWFLSHVWRCMQVFTRKANPFGCLQVTTTRSWLQRADQTGRNKINGGTTSRSPTKQPLQQMVQSHHDWQGSRCSGSICRHDNVANACLIDIKMPR